MTHDAEVVPLLVTFGHPGDGSFDLRFPAEYAEEIQTLLDDHGITHGTVLEFSAGAELWIETVNVLNVAGGLVALTATIKAFIHRNAGKRFILERNGEVFQASGFSEKEVGKLLERLADEQAVRDAGWERILRDMNEEANQPEGQE